MNNVSCMELMKNIENSFTRSKIGNFLKESFKEEWPTMFNHLIASTVSISSATGFSYYAQTIMNSDALISGIATVLDFAGYWGTLIPQLAYRDREKFKNEEGKTDSKKLNKKLKGF